MLNANSERELAYIVKVTDITPMNADRLELAHINGWHCVVGKGEFAVGDYAVYFEVDSKLPEVEPFVSMEFLASKHFKVKTQKIRGEISQGLLMSLETFKDSQGRIPTWLAELNVRANTGEEILNTFLTKDLGVTYIEVGDNTRKASSADKYKKMAQRHRKIATTFWWRWLIKRTWGKKLLFFFFGKKKDKKGGFPAWVVKTDEERIQNLPHLFSENKEQKWIATEKIDGTSTTFTLKRKGRKREFFVCSRNVCFDKPDKKCFYDKNVYTEMAEKYSVEKILNKILDENPFLNFVTIQGETYGGHIQKRNYGLVEHDFAAFNIIFGFKDGEVSRMNPIEGSKYAEAYGLPYVPIVDTEYVLPSSCEKVLEDAAGSSTIDGGMREGLVFRDYEGKKSFKAVSNEYLLKYHNG